MTGTPRIRTVAAAATLCLAAPCFAQAVVPGELRSYATPQSIGVEWDITGDANDDATVFVRYRVAGAAEWQDALPFFRVDFADLNQMSGSLLFLGGGTTYELELTLADPDGGGTTETLTVATRPVPVLGAPARTWHVAPGSGGGDGSADSPFLGFETADAAASPGDLFVVHAGSYGTDTTYLDAGGDDGEYVAWVAAPDEAPPQLGPVRIRADYVWLEGVAISAPDNALRNEGASVGAVVRGNHITDCHYCIHLNEGAEGWWISDNVIVGTADPASGDLDGEGIELQHTAGHTVAYNSISRVADGVSYPHRNVDIFGNDIFETSDDGIEPDYGFQNIRIWGNRIHHANNNGITFQPMNGAPWYVLYNQVIGSNESVLKVRDAVDRVLVAHNTFVGWGRVYQNNAGWIRNMTTRNNLWITLTGEYLWEDTGNPDIPDNWRTDLDYDGFAWPDDASPPLFKWHNVRYDDLDALQAATDIEAHAIRVPMSCFEGLNVPGPPPAVVPPQHVTLGAGCAAVDAGAVLPGINDGFLGEAPDLGAYERGAPLPHYGPRPSGLAPPSPPTGVAVE